MLAERQESPAFNRLAVSSRTTTPEGRRLPWGRGSRPGECYKVGTETFGVISFSLRNPLNPLGLPRNGS